MIILIDGCFSRRLYHVDPLSHLVAAADCTASVCRFTGRFTVKSPKLYDKTIRYSLTDYRVGKPSRRASTLNESISGALGYCVTLISAQRREELKIVTVRYWLKVGIVGMVS